MCVACRKLIQTAVDQFGGIDILILNAGVSAHSLFKDIADLEIFKTLMNTNFFGYLYPANFPFEFCKLL